MRIAFMDMIYTRGHLTFNDRIIQFAEKNNEVVVIHNHYYDKAGNGFIQCDKIKEPSGVVLGRVREYLNLKVQFDTIKRKKVDFIIILNCDWVALYFVIEKLLNIAPVAVVHHNLNYLDNRIKYNFYLKYGNKVKNIVLDDFCVDALIIHYKVNPSRVKLLRLPSTFSCDYALCSGKYISQLSGSIDQEFLDGLFKIRGLLRAGEKKVIVKNTKIDYEDDKIRFISGVIPGHAYNEYFKNSFAIFLSLPKDWQYRVSTLAIGAIMNRKILICNSNEFSKALKNKYPNIVLIYSDVDELVTLINCLPDNITEDMETDFSNAISDRSESTLENQFETILY